MAKPRRPQSTSTKPLVKPAEATGRTGGRRAVAPPKIRPAASARRTTYVDAVALYERGLEALQRHSYQQAADLFETVLRQYPEEKELQERARLYLNICRRYATPAEEAPKSVDERLYAATLSINGGRYDEAIGHLRLVRDEDPDNDHALYMLAVAPATPAATPAPPAKNTGEVP
jgi:tetratricopeptide (TPR) repeat protein